MPVERVIYLPEAVIEDLLGRRLVRDVPQLFEYNGGLYRARPQGSVAARWRGAVRAGGAAAPQAPARAQAPARRLSGKIDRQHTRRHAMALFAGLDSPARTEAWA